MSRSSRTWLLILVALIVVVVAIGGAGTDGPPLDPRSVNPDGARGLVETLERLGAEVTLDASTPAPDTTAVLVLIDRSSDKDADELRDWVRNGGTLVVADPSSRFADQRQGFARPEIAAGDCSIPWLANTTISASGRTFASAGDTRCFGDREASFVTVTELGAGSVVSLGGARQFTNEQLGRLDNAHLAVSLLAPDPGRARITVLSPSTLAFGEESLEDLLATRLRNAIVMLLAAFLLYALFRMRRLGRVVREPQPVPIRGSELVLKAGVLSERSKDPGHAASVIREDFVRRWGKALAIPAGTAGEQFAERVAAESGANGDEVRQALSRPVTEDRDLVEVVQSLDAIDHLKAAGDTPGSINASLATQPRPADLTPDLTPDESRLVP